ncbi:GTP-binding protein [Pseudoflavonifractor sp. MSJ-30]|uniref:TIGR03943 family putative permease subunit n=1 Tax=Pseudoflavonifractor sp. MSJ-30 TaxID=2841525 RepID=UPI00209E53B8|nr:GTP-binding protein [Pseudoflavonifractor sp. MSJ-30]
MVMQQIPVYAFTGFLDSGKTKFIQETLEDPRFNAGERTLVLIFEEGEEEYDLSTYPKKNVYLEVLDQQTVTTEELKALQKKYKAERVVAELNGMQQVGDLYMRFPDNWAIAQEVMFADATTFMTYNANMRNLVMDKLMGAQMVVFNRMTPGQDVMPFHKLARAANRRIDILYDYTDGTTKFDEIEDPLPFDINAPVIEVKDEDYALWYRDVSEEPEKYDGKTVHFKGQVAMLRRDKNGMFAPGRFVMTCCVEDIQFCGIPCRYTGAGSLESRSWVWVTAKISAEKHPLYKGDIGPVLTAISVETGAEAADPDVATF